MAITKTRILLIVILLSGAIGAWFILNPKNSTIEITKEVSFLDILPSPLVFTTNRDINRKEQIIAQGGLSNKSFLAISYDLHGVCLLNGPASAVILSSSGGQTFRVSLSNYGTNCAIGEQKIVIPLADFHITEPYENINKIGIQFWYPTLYTVEIFKISVHGNDSEYLAEYRDYDASAQIISQFITPTPTPSNINQPPVAIATADIINPEKIPLKVEFRGYKSYDPEGKSLTYRWTFGDGNSFNKADANHTYQRPGTYTAQFTVSDGVNVTFFLQL